MKKLLIKIVALITAAAVASGGLVFGDDLGETDEEILVVNGSLAEVEENGRLVKSAEAYDGSELVWNSEWDWREDMNWDGTEYTYKDDSDEYQYGILNNGTVILLEYRHLVHDKPDEISIPAQIDGRDVSVIGSGYRCFPQIDETVTKIYIPDTVKIIGGGAFRDCHKVTSIEIPDSVEHIAEWAFYDCSSLNSVKIDNVQSIEDFAFSRCTSLTSIDIPEGVTAIANGVFSECVSLSEITIPESVTSIGESAFYMCESLSEIVIPDGVTSIGSGTFYSCTSLSEIVIPDGVVSIGTLAFYYCTSLSEITIPDSVISIETNAFNGCNLENIYYAGSENLWKLIKIDYYHDYNDFANLSFNCSEPLSFDYEDLDDGTIRLIYYRGTGSVIIPKTIDGKAVTVIGSGFLHDDYTITDVQIPDGVTSIEDNVFNGCGYLSEVTIPDSVASIGENAFENCDSLENVYYTGTEEQWGEISIALGNDYLTAAVCYVGDYDCELLEDRSIRLNKYNGSSTDIAIPSKIYGRDVTVIGEYAFETHDLMTSVEIPDSIVSIGDYAFGGCGLTSLKIPDSVVSIGDYAFSSCVWLTSLKIPEGVSIGDYAFSHCALTSLEIPEGVSIGESAFEYCNSLTSIEFSDGVSIGEYAFWFCEELTSVEIPDGVTSIDTAAFGKCKSLYSINVSAGNENYTSIDGVLYSKDGSELLCYPAKKPETSFIIPKDVTSIDDYAFSYCNLLTSIDIPDSVTSIGNSAFHHCTSLASIEIPNSVTIIGNHTFYYCFKLTSIEIPNSVISIGNSAFYRCASLTLIEIPNSVRRIGDSAFSNCKSLTSVKIPDNITSIGNSSFSDCTSLTSIEIPNSVTKIGHSAFFNCTSLTSIKIPDSVISIDYTAFFSHSSDLIIYGKEDSYAETYAKEYNIDFKPIEEFPPEAPIDPDDPDPDDPVSVTIGDYTVYFTEDNGALTITDITGSAPNLLIPAEINGKPVKAISEVAFANAEDIQSVYIPGSVDSIEGNPFAACPDLTDIYYGGTENKWYIAASGIPFEDDPLPDVTFHFGITGLSEEHPVKEAGQETVETAIKFNMGEDTPVIYIEGNQAAITEEGLAVIKALNTPVILQMKKYSLKINPDDIRIPSDFSILVKTAEISDNIQQWADPANSLMIIPQEPAEGDFGMTVEINLSEDILPFSANSAPYLYHIDGSDNIEDYSSALSCDKDSKVISVSLSHASKYLLTASAVDLGGGTSSGSEPPEPEVPSEPTNPSEPPEPEVPSEPTNPSEPPEPDVPGEPTNPSEPPEPEVPGEPTNPSEPPEPDVPGEPTNPSEPPEPEVPSEPTNPSEPPEPEVPSEPTNPSEPSDPEDPTDPANPSEPSDPEDPNDPTNPSEPSVPTDTLPSGRFVIPETTTPIITTSTSSENTAAANSRDGSAFSIEFETEETEETEETAEATVTADEAQPVPADTSSEMSTTVPPDEAEVSFDTTDSSVGNSGDANAPIGNAGADEAQDDKNVNTGDSSVSLTPLMIISAAVVFNGTALFGKKKKDK